VAAGKYEPVKKDTESLNVRRLVRSTKFTHFFIFNRAGRLINSRADKKMEFIPMARKTSFRLKV